MITVALLFLSVKESGQSGALGQLIKKASASGENDGHEMAQARMLPVISFDFCFFE